MYYWSRWSNITTTEGRENEMRETRSSWQESDYRQATSRETRPVLVVPRRRMLELSPASPYQRGQMQGRETSPTISLDVRRSRSYTTGTRSLTSANWQPEATTQPVLPE
jgi:hypothetical protein